MLAELPVERVIAIGESQSAMRLTTYINAVDQVAQTYDGFFVHARGRSGSPLDARRCRSVIPRHRPSRSATTSACRCSASRPRPTSSPSATTPHANPTTTGSVCGRSPARRPRRRVHVRRRVSSTAARSRSPSSPRRGARPTSPMGFELEQPDQHGSPALRAPAALAHFDRWLRDGTPPPTRAAPRGGPAMTSHPFVVDEHGIARGGIRTPHVDVPVAVLRAIGNSGAPISRLCGRDDPVHRGEARVALLEQGRLLAPSSTPRPTPPSPPAGSSEPTPRRSKPSPPS